MLVQGPLRGLCTPKGWVPQGLGPPSTGSPKGWVHQGLGPPEDWVSQWLSPPRAGSPQGLGLPMGQVPQGWGGPIHGMDPPAGWTHSQGGPILTHNWLKVRE